MNDDAAQRVASQRFSNLRFFAAKTRFQSFLDFLQFIWYVSIVTFWEQRHQRPGACPGRSFRR